MAKAKRAGSRRGKSTWVEIMSAWAQSGLSQAAFCKERGIPYSTFQYWRSRRKVREKRDTRSLAPVPVPPPFLPVQVIKSRPVVEERCHALTVLLPGGCRIEYALGGIPSNEEEWKYLVDDTRSPYIHVLTIVAPMTIAYRVQYFDTKMRLGPKSDPATATITP